MAQTKRYYGQMASSPSHGAALEMAADLRPLLRKYGLAEALETRRYRKNGEEYWGTSCGRLHLDFPLAGQWTLSMYWRFITVPGSERAALLQSSVGLNVVQDILDHQSDPDEEVCLVRYDYEANDKPYTHHLNVLQPRPLRDSIHWRLPLRTSVDPWGAPEIFEYLFKAVPAELLRKSWPVS